MAKARVRKTRRQVRHKRVRRKVFGSPERPRMAVFRSLKQHLRPDNRRRAGAIPWWRPSSLDPDVRGQINGGKPKSEVAALVGSAIAERALDKGIKSVVLRPGRLQVSRQGKSAG